MKNNFDGAIDYNVKGYSRALYFNFTMKGLYHPDDFIREKLEADASEIDKPESPAGNRKPSNRGERRRATKNHKKALRRLAKVSFAEIRPTGKVKDYGYKSYLKGDKLYTRANRKSAKVGCREYQEEPAYIPAEEVQEKIGGNWDVDSQKFISDYVLAKPQKHHAPAEIPQGWYFVVTTAKYCDGNDAIIDGEDEHTILAYYSGNCRWSDELLDGSINYRMRPVKIPAPSEIK